MDGRLEDVKQHLHNEVDVNGKHRVITYLATIILIFKNYNHIPNIHNAEIQNYDTY